MSPYRIAIVVLACAATVVTCVSSSPPSTSASSSTSGADSALVAFIDAIKAVDNHTHVNSTVRGDADADALPLDGIAPFELPATLRPESADSLAAYKGLYKFAPGDLADAHMTELRSTMERVAKEQGEKFPIWVLDQIGTEVMFANRIAMGPGLTAPRFRWVSYADALMFPLPTTADAATTPDRKALFPLEEKLLRRYLADLKIARRPDTLDGYLKLVVTPTLEAQQRGGCLAVKFESAYLRALDFEDVALADASRVYARYARGGEPSRAEYKPLQDFLFRYIAREAGRLGMAVHIHSFEGAGNYFATAGADPLLLEPVLNDPLQRKTNFVIIHGGGIFSSHTRALLWKPNVFADMSLMTLAYTPAKLADVLRDWLTQFPEKVLFGTDASAFGPDMGWELTAWIGTRNGRAALALALTRMIHDGDVTAARAREIATMVMRTNAGKLYRLQLN
jgi:uncharacterized protein